MQKGLEDYLVRYNTRQPYEGLNKKARISAQAFERDLPNTLKGGPTRLGN